MRVLLSIMISGCFGGGVHLNRDTVPAYLDADAVEASIMESVAQWEACGVTPHAVVMFADISGFMKLGVGGPFVVMISNKHQWTMDLAGCNGQWYLPSLMRHELGHAGALLHTDDQSDIMFPTFRPCEDRLITSSCKSAPAAKGDFQTGGSDGSK